MLKALFLLQFPPKLLNRQTCRIFQFKHKREPLLLKRRYRDLDDLLWVRDLSKSRLHPRHNKD